MATVKITLTLEEEKHSCQSGSKCLSFSKGSLHVWLNVARWSFNWFKCLAPVGSGALGPPICRFPLCALPPALQQKKKNHLIISGQCGCSLKWVTETTLVLYTLLLSKGLLHPRPISPPLTDHLVRRRKVSHSFQRIFTLWFLPYRKKERKTGKTEKCRSKWGNVLKASHASETWCNPLGLKNGNKDKLFLVLYQEDVSLTGTRVRTRTIGNWNK